MAPWLARWLRRARELPLTLEAAAELVLMKTLVVSVAPARYAHLVDPGEQWSEEEVPPEALRRLVSAIERAGRFAPAVINCLPRALALQRMLWRRGVRGTVQFGIKKANGQVEAHAWLVLRGQVLMGHLPDLDRFVRFPTWPEFLSRRPR